MPVDRPTFSESWYRVAELRPRLRATVQIFRQHFRGRMWHVIQDPSSNQFFRLNEAAYRFVGLMDGRRTIAEVWKACNEELGDAAPTQGEVIQLLGQLYASNLIHAEMPPDAEGLFNRYQKRVSREVKGYLTNLLFIRVPLFDPDHILDDLLPAVKWVFSWIGLLVWAVLISVAGYLVIGRASELAAPAANILDPSNLPLLFVSFWIVKVLHEFGHGFACKKFGRDAGLGGEVHTMGIMFLVFTPLPYVDASSAWAFRSRYHRIIVGLGGMIIELGVASVAAVVWARTGPGTLHAIAYNVMFIASVSTLIFNANPLLRYDGYYVLSDLLEIPNLSNRSKEYLTYLVKRYAWGVKRARNPAHTAGERFWFVTYGIASTIYRVVIVSAILLFVASKLFFVGMILATAALAAWLLVPLGKLLKYLAASGELARVRGRAMATVAAFAALLVIGLGFVPADDRSRAEGVVEPAEMAFVHPRTDGFVRRVTDSDRHVTAEDVLIVAENPELEARLRMLEADRAGLVARMHLSQNESIAAAQSLSKAIVATDRQIADVRGQLDDLELRPPLAGRWISPNIERLIGAYVTRGQRIGLVASDALVIRAVAEQDISAQAYEEYEEGQRVEIRVKDRPDLELGGAILSRMPAGQRTLPSAALGYNMGGSVQTAMSDPEGRKTAEPVFEIVIRPDSDTGVRLLSGERVMVRFTGRPKPLARQWWRAIRRLVQQRFHG